MADASDMPTTRLCAAPLVYSNQLQSDPGFVERRTRMDSEARDIVARGAFSARAGVTHIPVVVHVLWNTEGQNLSDEQIISQIDVLNADFRKNNADLITAPTEFQHLADDAQIQFALADTDPLGQPTTGITRTQTQVESFTFDDAIKFATSGGTDAWPADRYLNVWVAHLGGGLLGYAQFPGGAPKTDGVVIRDTAFGTVGTVIAPFDRGRTATHEIGHWLNLNHIWGDESGCIGTDKVDDTPNQAGANTGKPAFPQVTCGNAPHGDLFVDYMDYVDDDVMVLFSVGQVERMHACLEGPRSTFETVADSRVAEEAQAARRAMQTDIN